SRMGARGSSRDSRAGASRAPTAAARAAPARAPRAAARARGTTPWPTPSSETGGPTCPTPTTGRRLPRVTRGPGTASTPTGKSRLSLPHSVTSARRDGARSPVGSRGSLMSSRTPRS
ncbi:MAG: hypothetical protein GWN18_10840, partial [Thermoplasmata archaeon]|nr:hypothetical protein [Thermoplasmata archaeon]NIS12535.1 hypothetical protein [Thermoplasmata archaeon]NIT77807.1 hypothetical protein [Thermoplasmata archaeon]NIU49545.1 hypothetical protein [Thermoplasmata archaeon]NIV79216.1 hypothetical protein [Thermoplasmata archaeon]